jgi:hypothetical protein
LCGLFPCSLIHFCHYGSYVLDGVLKENYPQCFILRHHSS